MCLCLPRCINGFNWQKQPSDGLGSHPGGGGGGVEILLVTTSYRNQDGLGLCGALS